MSSNNNSIEDGVELLNQIQSGNRIALDTLYHAYSGALYRLILGMTKDRLAAEEILQDTFLKIWNKADQYDSSKGRLFTWMVRIARNTALDRMKTKRYQRNAQLGNVDDLVAQGQEARFAQDPQIKDSGLQNVVHGLKEKHQRLVEYLYFRDYTQKETSEALDMPLGTVKTEIRKAIMELRRRLKKEI